MFGSNFDTNFGIPGFPVQNMDPQGGLFSQNTGPAQSMADQGAQGVSPGGAPGLNLPDPAAGSLGASAPATGVNSGTNPAAPALGAPSALGGGVLSPGAASGAPPSFGTPPDAAQGQAPAAGLGSPFGKSSV